MSPYILTSTGAHFDFERMAPINIRDIAHALAHQCRFTGHTRRFYSVAQHSVLVSHIVPPHLALHGLLHDAGEAYLGDVSRPLKRLLPDYRAIERRLEAVLWPHFGLSPELPPEVARADMVLLATERRDLMPFTDDEWPDLAGVDPLPIPIDPWHPGRAFGAFWQRWNELQARGEAA